MCDDCVLSRIPVGGRCATHSAVIHRDSIGAWLASNWPSPSQPIGWTGNCARSEIGPSLRNHHGLRGSPSPLSVPPEPSALPDRFGRLAYPVRAEATKHDVPGRRLGRALLSTHASFLDAEDAALRYWLGSKPKGHDGGEFSLKENFAVEGRAKKTDGPRPVVPTSQ
jgi:hypothetical protein